MFTFLYFYIALFFCSAHAGAQEPHKIFYELAELLRKKEDSLFKQKLDQAVKEGFDPSYEYSPPQGEILENDYTGYTLLYVMAQLGNKNIACQLAETYKAFGNQHFLTILNEIIPDEENRGYIIRAIISEDCQLIRSLIYERRIKVLDIVILGFFSGNVKFLRSLKRLGIPFNFDKFNDHPLEGETLLHSAVWSGNLKAVEFFFDCFSERDLEIDIDIQNGLGHTALRTAVDAKCPEIVRYLLSKGVDANKEDFIGRSPLFILIGRFSAKPFSPLGAEEKECINLLMAYGANYYLGTEIIAQSILPSMIFLLPPYRVFYELVKLLQSTEPYLFKELLEAAIKEGFDPFSAYNCPDNEVLGTEYWGHNFLHVACTIENKNIDLVRYLFDINPDCFNNLKILQDLNIIEYLFDNEIIDEDKLKSHLVIEHACTYGNIKLLKYLEGKGLSLNFSFKEKTTPLHTAVSLGNLEMVEYLTSYLLKRGLKTDIDKRDYLGNTPLHIAANKKEVEIIECLISKGADMRKENFYKETPFSSMLVKCWNSYFSKEEEDCIDLFVKHGAASNNYCFKLERYLQAKYGALNASRRLPSLPIKRIAISEEEMRDVEECAKKRTRTSFLQ